MSVLFSDIRAFTSLSERMSSAASFKFINAYLSRMEPAIINNNGFIDKYIGDAIMALFSGSADDAVTAGIAMLKLLDEALAIMNNNLNDKYNEVSIEAAVLKENEINEMRNKLRKEHIKDIENGTYDIRIGTLYKDLFHACEKIGDHIMNITEAITGEKEREVKSEIIPD